jgi:hypothetical protein
MLTLPSTPPQKLQQEAALMEERLAKLRQVSNVKECMIEAQQTLRVYDRGTAT